MHVVVIFGALSPYHLVRMAAAEHLAGSRHWRITTIERVGSQEEYPAFGRIRRSDVSVRCAYDETHPSPSDKESVLQLRKLLSEINPHCVVFGRSSPVYFSVLWWCIENSVPCVLLSDSTIHDFKRVVWKEWIKGHITRLFSAGFAAGTRQREYLADLGMQSDRVALGYDVVDNSHFSVGADAARQDALNLRKRWGLPDRFILASSRFLERKNLLRLLDSFGTYVERYGAAAWNLVILGDGPLRGRIEEKIIHLGLLERVSLRGWICYEDLPGYYGLASAFILPSTSEQWGLVVNEAMAAGLPVLLSERCGCQPDLVIPGVNGFIFDPFDVGAITNVLSEITLKGDDCYRMGQEGRRIVAHWSPERFAAGLMESVELAIAADAKKIGVIDRVLLRALCPA